MTAHVRLDGAPGRSRRLRFRDDVVDPPVRLEPAAAGTTEFDAEIENPAFEGSPLFTFRGDLIARVDSSVVPLT